MDKLTGSAPMRRGFLLLFFTAALLSACAPSLQQVKGPVELPERFSASGTEPQRDRWWLSFEDQVLESLIDRALAENLSLLSAWDRLDQAQAVARKAGADLVPSLDAEAIAARSRFRENGRTDDASSYALGLVAGYEVDLWGRIRSSRDAAALDAQASAEDLQAAAITLASQVVSNWYQLVEQYGQLELLDAQIAINEKTLELVTLQFRTGQVGIADVLQQRQLVESNRGEKAQVASSAGVLEHQLAILLGLPPGYAVAERISELATLPALPATGVPAELLQRRPDIRSAWYQVMAADSDVAAAIADRFPRLGLSAQLDTSGGHTSDLFNNWLASLAGNLIGPLIDGGLRKAEVERSRAAASEALHSYGQTVLEALGEVEDALVREHRQHQFIASLDKQLELAEQAIERVRDRYTKGATDYQRVLDAQLSHQQLQRSRLSAERELIEDRIALYRALGGGWQMERHAQTSFTAEDAEKNKRQTKAF